MFKVYLYYTDITEKTGDYYQIKEYHLFGILVYKKLTMKNIRRLFL